MSRFHYFTALAWLVAAVMALGFIPGRTAAVPLVETETLTEPQAWFRRVKPLCNSLEVEMAVRNIPPPQSLDGSGYAAACFAIAGRIDEARSILTQVDPADRWKAAAIVFDVGHPIADAGDDRSAGPIMGLVVEFWPNHYMALYHAGMANYSIGELVLSRQQLERFLELYQQQDGWRSNALTVLERFKR